MAINSGQDVQPHGGSADIADVEDEPSQGDGEGKEIAESGQDFVGHVLSPHA